MPRRRAAGPKSVDAYLDRVPPDSRAALQRLRKIIRAAAPGVVEEIRYGMPTFRHGSMRLHIAAFKDHCSVYGWARVRSKYVRELGPFEEGKGTLRFTPERPLPDRLVTRMVKSLVALDVPRRSQ